MQHVTEEAEMQINENDTLCFRVAGRYLDTSPGGRTSINSGYVTLADARKLLDLFTATSWIKDARIQIRCQGEDWHDYTGQTEC